MDCVDDKYLCVEPQLILHHLKSGQQLVLLHNRLQNRSTAQWNERVVCVECVCGGDVCKDNMHGGGMEVTWR